MDFSDSKNDVLWNKMKRLVQLPSQSIQTFSTWNGRFVSVGAGVQLTNSFSFTTPNRTIKILDLFAWANKVIPVAIPLDCKLSFAIAAGGTNNPYSAPDGFIPAAPTVLVQPQNNPIIYSFPIASNVLKTEGFYLYPNAVYNFQVIATGTFAIADQTDVYSEMHYQTI
jgi:hypothetical protein